jgi:hypothetical protein
MFNLKNPIPRSQDSEKVRTFFKEYGIIPYYGTSDNSSHKFLDLQMSLTSLSPSYVACLADLTSYSLGSNFSLVGRVIPGLVDDPTELSGDQKREYLDFLTSLNISLVGIIDRLKNVLRYEKDNGNAYIHLKRVTVGDSVKYFIKTPHYKHCAYLETKDPGIEFIIISKHLAKDNAEELLKKFPPTIIRATRYGEDLSVKWDKTGSGVEEAIIHIFNTEHNDEGDIYGRPKINSVLTWLYTDFQVGNLNSKVAATELITKKILAIEAPDPRTIPNPGDGYQETEITSNGNSVGSTVKTVKKEDYFERNKRVLREVTTNLGSENQVSAIGLIEYPHSKQPPTDIELEVNRDTKHHSWQMETASSVICSVLQWSSELTNIRQAKANLGGNLLYDLFTIKNTTTIRPLQAWLENIANYVLDQICIKEEANADFKTYGIQLPDIISGMIQEFKGDPAIVNPLANAPADPADPDPAD